MVETAAARPKVLLVSLGGTITMTSGAGAGIVPTLTGADLVRAVPALADVADIETASPFRLPGPSLTLANLREVAQLLNDRLAGDITGAIVVQGTDTIEETAFVLDLPWTAQAAQIFCHGKTCLKAVLMKAGAEMRAAKPCPALPLQGPDFFLRTICCHVENRVFIDNATDHQFLAWCTTRIERHKSLGRLAQRLQTVHPVSDGWLRLASCCIG